MCSYNRINGVFAAENERLYNSSTSGVSGT